ncbi:MAG TPA: serine hydrolase, partial [Verrucomicrobiae bacterium]|nr:serine hydrolase [Verrucomicrobiae bacterium]
PITLLHLATHTSGLPRHRGEVHPANWRNPEAGYSVEQLAAGLARFRLARAPGTQYQYSNVGMEILGYAIALKAGKDYETLVRDRICRPLGMESTFVSVPPELRPRMARGHAMPGRPVPDMDFSPLCASAGLRSTANDLLKFVSACAGLTPSPLEPLLEKPEAPHALKSGAKVPLAWQSDGNFFQHSGMTYGFTANVAFDRNRRRAVVMLANCNSSLGFIQGRLGRAISAGRSPEPARTVSLAPAMLNQYAGLYRTDGGATYTVRREGAGLMVRPLNEPGERFRDDGFGVFPQSASVLYNKLWDVDAVFSRAAGGAAPRMTVAWPKFTLEAVRVSNDIPPTPDPIQVDPSIYDSFAGRYRHMLFCGLVPVGPTLIIRREDDELGAHLMAYMRCKYIAALARNQDSNDLGGTDMTGLELFPDTKTAYGPAVTLANLRLEFALNKQGKTTGLTVEANGKTFTAKRVSAKPVAWK